jgi:hypothetical protein
VHPLKGYQVLADSLGTLLKKKELRGAVPLGMNMPVIDMRLDDYL